MFFVLIDMYQLFAFSLLLVVYGFADENMYFRLYEQDSLCINDLC